MIERPRYLSALEPFIGKQVIKVLVGVRRSGKSTLLALVQNELERHGVSRADMLTVNFESARFSHIASANGRICVSPCANRPQAVPLF